MVFPFKDITKCRLTCPYGKPGTHWASGKHDGVDLVSDGDKTVISVSAGTVIRSRYTSDGWGQHVVVRMADGRSIVYGHLVKDSLKVVTGDKITVGQVIGTMGNTGNSEGAHLHIELQKSYYKCGATDDITAFLGIANIKTTKAGEIQILGDDDMQTCEVKLQMPDGAILTADGYVVDGTTYLPLREVLEKLGHKVGWKDGKITISK